MLVQTIGQDIEGRLYMRVQKTLKAGELDPALIWLEPVHVIKLPKELGGKMPVKVVLVDNTSFLGYFKNCIVDIIEIVTPQGISIIIPEEKIMDVRWPEGKMVGGQFYRYDPTHHRLFFGPTGRTLKAGNGEFADFYVVFPTIALSLTDFFMLGGGVSLIPGADDQLFYISPKVRFIHGSGIILYGCSR